MRITVMYIICTKKKKRKEKRKFKRETLFHLYFFSGVFVGFAL